VLALNFGTLDPHTVRHFFKAAARDEGNFALLAFFCKYCTTAPIPSFFKSLIANAN